MDSPLPRGYATGVEQLRLALRARAALAVAAILLALLPRLLVPAGYMPERQGGFGYLAPCSGHGAMTMPGMAGHTDGDGKADQHPCGFGALHDSMLGSVDGIPPLAAAVLRLVRADTPAQRAPALAERRLRPPLRAPPKGIATL